MTGKYNRKIKRGIVMPVQQFINREKSAGVVLGISIVVAMVLANSPWSEDYFHLFENKVGFFFNGEPYLYYSLHHWINDGLMSMFFFVVGLELKREFIGGELSDPRNTILPIGAAVAGMLVPALIYTLLNAGTGAAGGWGIPMATDIAFSLAIIYLLGDRRAAGRQGIPHHAGHCGRPGRRGGDSPVLYLGDFPAQHRHWRLPSCW